MNHIISKYFPTLFVYIQITEGTGERLAKNKERQLTINAETSLRGKKVFSVLHIVMWNIHCLPHTQFSLTKSRRIQSAIS